MNFEHMTPKEIKKKFLVESDDLSQVKSTNVNHSISKFLELGNDDEVWIMQCPKDFNISELNNENFMLPGRSNIKDHLLVGIEFENVRPQAIGYQNDKGHTKIKTLPIHGSIILKKSLPAIEPINWKTSESLSSDLTSIQVPLDIPQRHPLYGPAFEKKVNIDPAILKLLQNADQKSEEVLKKSLQTQKTASDSLSKRKRSSDLKKLKKCKISCPIDENISLKKIKLENDDISEDLQWIQKL